MLTDTQRQILDFVRAYAAEKGFPPTRAEIAAKMGYSSENAAREALQAIEAKGFIALSPRIARGIRLIEQAAP